MNQVQKFLVKLFNGIGSPRSMRFRELAVKGDWAALQALPMPHPSSYRFPNVYLRDAITHAIVKKAVFPGDGAARKKKAVDKFYAAEAQCKATNARLKRISWCISSEFFPEDHQLRLATFIKSWRSEVRRVLGDFPGQLDLKYSKGSTLSDKGKQVTIPDKMSSAPTGYPGTQPLYEAAVAGTALMGLHSTLEVTRSNRLFTVPKNCDEDRLAATEASASISLQLAAGQMIRSRYNRGYQVDMSELQPLHREMAQYGSVDGSLATIDLSSASDMVSYELVKLVLPPRWFELLNSLRATHTDVFGRSVYLEKFSTMGNGYTFELETLLFRSLCAVLGCPFYGTSVYGDDIIIPTEHYADVASALQYFGLVLNEKKSFCEGPFRESCGGDFFEGVPVRGHYMKELPDEPQHWVALANGLLRVDPEQRWTRAAWRFCIDQLPTIWRSFGPQSFGDIVLHHPTGEWREKAVRRGGELWVWAHVPVPAQFRVDQHFSPEVVLAAATFGVPSLISARESVRGYRRKLLPTYGLSLADSQVGEWLATAPVAL